MASASAWPPKMAARCWRVAGPRAEKDSPFALLARNRLPRKLSLKSRVEIAALFKQGRRFQGNLCTLIWQPAESFAYGVFLSRGFGSAPRRNRAKRLYREAIRLGQGQLPSPGKLAILPRAAEKQPSFEVIKADVFRLFEELGRP